jgi:hypothetical protein
LAIEKLKSHKSPGIDQIQSELITGGDRTIRSEIHELVISVIHEIVISVWNKYELREEWKVSIIAPMYKKGR